MDNPPWTLEEWFQIKQDHDAMDQHHASRSHLPTLDPQPSTPISETPEVLVIKPDLDAMAQQPCKQAAIFSTTPHLSRCWSLDSPSASYSGNHPSATQHPSDVIAYINKELKHACIIGPVQSHPFQWPWSNPMMTRPKKDSSMHRVIMDLSMPQAPVSTPASPRTPSTVLPSTSGYPTQPPWPKRFWNMGEAACSTRSTSAEPTGSSGPTPWTGLSSCCSGKSSFSWISPSPSAFVTELQHARGLRKPSQPSLERRSEPTPPLTLMTPSEQPCQTQHGPIITTSWSSWPGWAWMQSQTIARAPPPLSSGSE